MAMEERGTSPIWVWVGGWVGLVWGWGGGWVGGWLWVWVGFGWVHMRSLDR